MYKLVWSQSFIRTFKKADKTKPHLRTNLEKALKLLSENPYSPALHTHKLKGELMGTLACSIDYRHRIIFEIRRNHDTDEDEVLLLSFGTHDEVY